MSYMTVQVILNRLLFLLSNDILKESKYRQTMSEHGNEFNVET